MQCMLDLETMGNSKNAAIISIGAVLFDNNGLVDKGEFYSEINLQTCIDCGLQMDASTVMWWMGQDSQAKRAFIDNNYAEHLIVVLENLSKWISKHKVEEVWGNGASFDNAILSNAYTKCKIEQPWKFWNDRCYRTLKNLYPSVKLNRVGTHHHALDDAKSQALHLVEIFKEMGK